MLARLLDLTGKVLKSNIDRLDHPYKLVFVVTKECHSRCVNCKIWKVKPNNELTLPEIQRLAQNSPFLSWLNITGGEPTDRADLVEIVESFLKHCPRLVFVNFATNGLRPTHIHQVCQAIADLKPPRFTMTVSIDGPPKVNDGLRGIKGDFDAAVKTLELLSGIEGLDAYVGMTLYPGKNLHLIDETVAAIRDRLPWFDHSRLHVNIPHVSQHYYENDQVETHPNKEIVEVLERFMTHRGFPMDPFQFVERLYQMKNIFSLEKLPWIAQLFNLRFFFLKWGSSTLALSGMFRSETSAIMNIQFCLS
jgi:MoaA/NifB/PqqE/SkfB family radical SAM enzyme